MRWPGPRARAPRMGGPGAGAEAGSLDGVRVVRDLAEAVVVAPLHPERQLLVLGRIGLLEGRPLLIELFAALQELVLLLLGLRRPPVVLLQPADEAVVVGRLA